MKEVAMKQIRTGGGGGGKGCKKKKWRRKEG